MTCHGSVALAASAPRQSSTSYADEGTLAHEMAARALIKELHPRELVGQPSYDVQGRVFEEDFVEGVTAYVEDVRRRAQGAALLVEQRVTVPGVPECWGTSDAIIVRDDEIEVVDLKFGRGVRVDAQGNPQLALYAVGAVHHFGALADVKRARMTIHQPRLGHTSEAVLDIDELSLFATTAAEAAERALAGLQGRADPRQMLTPGEDQCRFCPAKATCPALRDEVINTIVGPNAGTAAALGLDGFADLDRLVPSARSIDSDEDLAQAMSRVGLIEDWCKAIRSEVERRLLAGAQLPGWKLVQGRQGARKWSDERAVEELLRKTFRLPADVAYERTVISPTAAERLVRAGELGDRRWERLQSLIKREPGKVSVAPATDPRPSWAPSTVDGFEDVTADS